MLLLTCTNLTLVLSSPDKNSFFVRRRDMPALNLHRLLHIIIIFDIPLTSSFLPLCVEFFSFTWIFVKVFLIAMFNCAGEAFLPLVSNVNTISIVYRRDNNESNNNGSPFWGLIFFAVYIVLQQISKSKVQQFKNYVYICPQDARINRWIQLAYVNGCLKIRVRLSYVSRDIQIQINLTIPFFMNKRDNRDMA